MCHRQLGETEEARQCYDKGIAFMEQKQLNTERSIRALRGGGGTVEDHGPETHDETASRSEVKKKKRPVRLTAKQAPHRPGISRGARFARTRAMTF